MFTTILKAVLVAAIVISPGLSPAAESETKPAAPSLPVSATPQPATPDSAPAGTAAAAPTPAAANAPANRQPAEPTAKIGYVDMGKILRESDRGKAFDKLLTGKKDQLQAKIDARKKQIEKLKSSIEASISTMNPHQREAKSKEFQKKLEDFQKFARASEEELFKLQEQETKTFYAEIEKTAAAHGKANSFSVIIVKKELLYLGSPVTVQDVTDALIQAMDEAGRKK